MMKIGCVLLAGGLARRMGGGDKGLRKVQGKPMIEHVLETVVPQVDQLVINANGDPARFASFGYDVVGDSIDGFVGPLAGVLAGMDAMATCDYILSVPSDTPFLPSDLVEKLKTPVEIDKVAIAMAHSGGHDHPVVALWSISLRDDLRRALIDEGMRKLKLWISRYSYACVEWTCDGQDPFFNANRPEDLADI
jgi:molybdopterin-guanine dinucleotide biosynthesis protein A